MGGCATKPNVLKEEGEAPVPAAGEEKKEELVEGRKSLGNFFAEKEAEENTAAVNEEKPEEEKEDAKPEQQDKEKKATEATEAKPDTDTAAVEEKQQ